VALKPEKEQEIAMFLKQISIPCRPIDYLKAVWKEYLIMKYEIDNLRKKQRINKP